MSIVILNITENVLKGGKKRKKTQDTTSKNQLWLSRSSRLAVWSHAPPCQNVIEQNTEPQIAPDG